MATLAMSPHRALAAAPRRALKQLATACPAAQRSLARHSARALRPAARLCSAALQPQTPDEPQGGTSQLRVEDQPPAGPADEGAAPPPGPPEGNFRYHVVVVFTSTAILAGTVMLMHLHFAWLIDPVTMTLTPGASQKLLEEKLTKLFTSYSIAYGLPPEKAAALAVAAAAQRSKSLTYEQALDFFFKMCGFAIGALSTSFTLFQKAVLNYFAAARSKRSK